MNNITPQQKDMLVDAAIAVRGNAYAPYSNFRVGAAVLLADGETIISGCNVENASYGLSICAERNAICQAVALSGPKPNIMAIAVAADPLATPCGACRQFIAEFGDEILLICVGPSDKQKRSEFLAKELLPHGFSKEVLDR
ncbi:cytidine deaminase [bacterium]|nr:cytidine deaminase [bacterium]